MMAAAEAAGVRLFVVKQNRFNPRLKRFAKRRTPVVLARWSWARCAFAGAAMRVLSTGDVARHLGGRRRLPDEPNHPLHRLDDLDHGGHRVGLCPATRLVDIEAEDTAAVVLGSRAGLGVIEATTASTR